RAAADGLKKATEVGRSALRRAGLKRPGAGFIRGVGVPAASLLGAGTALQRSLVEPDEFTASGVSLGLPERAGNFSPADLMRRLTAALSEVGNTVGFGVPRRLGEMLSPVPAGWAEAGRVADADVRVRPRRGVRTPADEIMTAARVTEW